jgi:uncharacterized cupin superfamily protein
VSDVVNLHEVALQLDAGAPAGYRKRGTSLRELLGSARLGAGVYQLEPGDSTWPYHYECVEEEWLLVLTGTPTLRDPDGEHELEPGDLVCFPPGPEGAHKVTNRSGAVTRFVIFSSVPKPDISIAVYPDSDKLSVWPPGKRLRMSPVVEYWDGEA